MTAVVLSHSGEFLRLPDHGVLSDWLVVIGMIATPTFLMLSGAICSHLGLREDRTESEARWRLIDRGLFLILVVHFVLGFTHALWEAASVALAHSVYITDAVGVGLIVAALVLGRLTRGQLIACGVALLVVSWTVSCLGAPADASTRFLLRILVGYDDHSYNDDAGWVVPIIPYLGLFLVGMAAGTEYTNRRRQGTSHDSIARFCIRAGVVSLLIAIAGKLCWQLARNYVPEGLHWPMYVLTQPFMKIPPSPAYLLAFGGLGLTTAGVLFLIASRQWGRPVAAAFAVVGRATLFVYVLQYWLISVPALVFGERGHILFWLAALAMVLAVAWALAWSWDRARGNRLLTLRLRGFARDIRQQAQAQQDASLKNLALRRRR